MDVESFSKTKAMELPRNVVVGHDAIHQVGEVCASLKLGRKALLVADTTTMKIAGNTAVKSLADRKIRATEFLIPDATWEEVKEAEASIRKGELDFALGVGGGRSIDVAKCASFNAGVPFVSVPTAASHDGVVSSRASITKKGEKVSFAAHTPIAVIMDTGIIAESPFRLLAAGCGDIISNLTAVKDWALARNLRNEYYSSYAASLSELAARLVIENASNIKPRLEESAWFVCKALVSSGVAMSIAGSSRPASGGEHKFSPALDRGPEKARPPRGAVRGRHDHDDVPPRGDLAGGPGRPPRDRRADDRAGARGDGRGGRQGARPCPRDLQGTLHDPRGRGPDPGRGGAARTDHEGHLSPGPPPCPRARARRARPGPR